MFQGTTHNIQELPSFNSLLPGQRSTCEIPNYDATLAMVFVRLTGAITKDNITEITIKSGSRPIFGAVSARQLDKILAYRGQEVMESVLMLDFTEFSAPNQVHKEIGGIDLPSLSGDKLVIEVANNLASGTFSLNPYAVYLPRQWVDTNPTGVAEKDAAREAAAYEGKLMHKLLEFPLSQTGSNVLNWTPNFRGSRVRRIHFMHDGVDWTTTANGDINFVEVKIDGYPHHDRINCVLNRYLQRRNKKVPQSKVYTLDFCMDDNFTKALDTRGIKSLEFKINTQTTALPVRAFVELWDIPANL